jgi:hypothetical protein
MCIQLLGNHHQHTATIGQNHQKEPLHSETWYSYLQLLESGSEKIRQTVIRAIRKWSVDYMLWWYILIWMLSGTLIRNYARYLEEINIREDKLLLYHCLLELGSPKVNVSEHDWLLTSLWVSILEELLTYNLNCFMITNCLVITNVIANETLTTDD